MSTVEQIKEKLNIVDVVSRYIKLEKSGANLKAKCPFHNERTPSFFISPDRGTYYCFGCGAKGDVFTFIQEFERVDFVGSLKILADLAGVEIEEYKSVDFKKNKSEKDRLLAIMESATAFYEGNLTKNKIGQEYLKQRGLKDRIIKDWRLGYAPDAWSELLDYLVGQGFTNMDIERAGLIKKGETKDGRAGGYYDRLRGRLIFPIFDPAGRTIAFSGRLTDEKKDEAKYINSPEGPLFNKSQVLYGYDRAKTAIREQNYAILVEGQMDLLMMHQAGLRNSVASSGTALTEHHLKTLKRSSENLLLAYDGDGAGLKAALRAWNLALILGMEVKIAELPKGEDPASLLFKNSNELKERLKNSKHIINFYLEAILAESKDRRKLIKEIERELLPLVRALPSSIDQTHFIKIIADKTSISEAALLEELNKITVMETEDDKTPSRITMPLADFRQRRLWGMLLWQEKEKEPKIDTKKIREKISEIVGQEEYEKMDKMSLEEKTDLMFEAETYFSEVSTLEVEVEELLSHLEEEYLKDQFAKTMMLLQQAEKEKKPAEIEMLIQKCQELSQKIASRKKFLFKVNSI